jgi:hypothetical protein
VEEVRFETYCGVWPIKCRQGSKTNKSNFRFWKKLTLDWLETIASFGYD